GQYGFDLHRSELEARFGVEAPDLGNHLGELLRVDANRALQARKVVSAEQVEVRQQFGNLGVVSILLAQLQSQAFGKRARKHARRIELLQCCQHRIDERAGRTQSVGELVQVADEIASLIKHVD